MNNCFNLVQNNNVLINLKEDMNMDQNHNHNSSIGCKVSECEFHCKDDNYCTLNKIEVVKHVQSADTVECTDCGSFKRG